MPISADKYRGATVEDLSPPPALSLTPTTPIHHALLTALSHDYTHLTVLAPRSTPSSTSTPVGTSTSTNTNTNTSTAARSPLLGYLSIPHLQSLLASGAVKDTDPVSSAMVRFDRRSRRRGVSSSNIEGAAAATSEASTKGKDEGGGGNRGNYHTITLATPLEELEAFFEGEINVVTTGKPEISGGGAHDRQKQEFAVVTDAERKFVLGVATRGDLEEFVRRRPR